YVSDTVGVPTVKDIIAELEKPGRDPRGEFKSAELKEGVEDLKDLVPGMILEGTITNVTNFGAFVDIGVHQDGLVHISALSNKFVKDPHSVVKTGDVVKVKVIEVDEKRRRIGLSMRLDDAAAPRERQEQHRPRGNDNRGARPAAAKPQQAAVGSFGSLLKDAFNKR